MYLQLPSWLVKEERGREGRKEGGKEGGREGGRVEEKDGFPSHTPGRSLF